MNGGGAGPFQTVNPVPGYTAGDLASRVFCSFLQPWQVLQRPKTLSTVAHFDYEMNVSDDMSEASEIQFSVRNGKSETENPSRCILACLVFYSFLILHPLPIPHCPCTRSSKAHFYYLSWPSQG